MAASPWLQATPAHLQEMLSHHSKGIRFDQDALIYKFGDPPDRICGAVWGAIAIQTDDAGVLCAPRAVGATVVSDGVILVSVSLAAIEEIAGKSPVL